MQTNAQKSSSASLKQCISLCCDFWEELAWTQAHCSVLSSSFMQWRVVKTLHTYGGTCKGTDSIPNLTKVCSHNTRYPKNSVRSIQFKPHFCLEKRVLKILSGSFSPFFNLSTALGGCTVSPSCLVDKQS